MKYEDAQAASKRKVSKLRRVFKALLVLALLLGAFHLVENYRGGKIWAEAKILVESKGFIWDWEKLVPKSVPADQNVMADPLMNDWFTKAASDKDRSGKKIAPASTVQKLEVPYPKETMLIAEIVLLVPGATPESGAQVYDWAELKNRRQTLDTDKLTQKLGRSLMSPMNFRLLEKAAPDAGPSILYVRGADTNFMKEMNQLISSKLVQDVNKTNGFKLQVNLTTAAGYLALTDPLKPQLDLIRAACEKPYSQLKGDYAVAYASPVYNFVTIRQVVQCLATRAQSHLLLGNPAAAAEELALLRQINGILLKTGTPRYLVSVMINVAVEGLQLSVFSDGCRLGLWQEPQLVQFQQHFAKVNLLPGLQDSLNGERAALCQFALRQMREGDFDFFSGSEIDMPSWLRRCAGKALIPKGWTEMNAAVVADYMNTLQAPIDLKKMVVSPAKVDEAMKLVTSELEHWSPYKMVAAIGIPNFSKAIQTACRNQNLSRMAAIACALERHRLATGGYPMNLPALTPRYLEIIPPDVLTGQPMMYKPTADKRYLLYSVGWDLKDDGGIGDKDSPATAKDWVWNGVPEKK